MDHCFEIAVVAFFTGALFVFAVWTISDWSQVLPIWRRDEEAE